MIERAAELIRNGGIVAFPTETVYGLGANALDPVAISHIYAIKQRPASSPLIVHVSSIEMAKTLTTNWSYQADSLAKVFWPGPLTLVLPKAAIIPFEITAGLETVGIRMPNHPTALALIETAGVPIAAPSANRFTQLSPTSAAHVQQGLGAAVDMILDGGNTTVGIESTVLSLATVPPTLLRPGMITREQIEAIIGAISTAVEPQERHASPGLHDKHYSPNTPLYLIDEDQPLPNGSGIYLFHQHPRKGATPRQMPAGPDDYAAVLYQTLHQCDSEGWAYIAVEPPPDHPAWAGILDRLRRASFR